MFCLCVESGLSFTNVVNAYPLTNLPVVFLPRDALDIVKSRSVPSVLGSE